jgi:hypothetical protein
MMLMEIYGLARRRISCWGASLCVWIKVMNIMENIKLLAKIDTRASSGIKRELMAARDQFVLPLMLSLFALRSQNVCTFFRVVDVDSARFLHQHRFSDYADNRYAACSLWNFLVDCLEMKPTTIGVEPEMTARKIER